MLTNNREIIGIIVEGKEQETSISLKNVVGIVVSQDPETGALKKEFAPLTMFAKDGEKGIRIDLPKASILFPYNLEPTLASAYTTFVTGVVAPPKPKIII